MDPALWELFRLKAALQKLMAAEGAPETETALIEALLIAAAEKTPPVG